MKRPIICIFGVVDIATDHFLNQDVITIYTYETDSDLDEIITAKQPDVYITVGENWEKFARLANAEYYIRRRWIHYPNLQAVNLRSVYYCYISNLSDNILTQPKQNCPLVSCFTPSYKSGDKIQRPFRSLLGQNYPFWEWIIINDSPESPENWELLKELQAHDNRIQVYSPPANTANIGHLKYTSANLARGRYLVELDHDDDLTPDCLRQIVEAFQQYPEAGFVYTDFAELYEGSLKPFQYGSFWAYGYGGYYAQRLPIAGYSDESGSVLAHVAVSANINNQTIQNIVGVPNHIRVWRKDVYQELGGHFPLPVADDYELLIRTFLNTRMVRIPYLGYFQYRNSTGNTTFKRNDLITMLQGICREVYQEKIQERLENLNISTQPNSWQPSTRLWEQPYDYQEAHCTLIYQDPKVRDTITVVIPTYKRPVLLRRAIDSVLEQTYQDFEIVVIGDHCPYLESVIEEYWHDPRIRWWNLESCTNDGGATPRNYALRMLLRTPWVAYLDDDNYWLPNHLESLKGLITDGVGFAFSSFVMFNEASSSQPYTIICDIPRLYRIDTSAILHRAELLHQYGYWKPMPKNGYLAHDWDLVSRWLDNGVSWKASKEATLQYCADPKKVDVKQIYEYWGDQKGEQGYEIAAKEAPTPPDRKLFCITTLHCLDRQTIFQVVDSFLEHTRPIDMGKLRIHLPIPWIIVAQGCSKEHLQKLEEFLGARGKDVMGDPWVSFQIVEVVDNLGCSKGQNLCAELSQDYHYVLHLEDDWVCQSKERTGASKDWLQTCLRFLQKRGEVSTLFLRHYATPEEKENSGWGRSVPYKCHKYRDNFDYGRKIKTQPIEPFENLEFREIPEFLFTFNPCIRRNPDYYRVGVYPLETYEDKSAQEKNWKSDIHDDSPGWGWCEAVAMEKIRDLKAYNVARGIFSHHEAL